MRPAAEEPEWELASSGSRTAKELPVVAVQRVLQDLPVAALSSCA
jgi:hypothetical protein